MDKKDWILKFIFTQEVNKLTFKVSWGRHYGIALEKALRSSSFDLSLIISNTLRGIISGKSWTRISLHDCFCFSFPIPLFLFIQLYKHQASYAFSVRYLQSFLVPCRGKSCYKNEVFSVVKFEDLSYLTPQQENSIWRALPTNESACYVYYVS